jgi:hypothetical protein
MKKLADGKIQLSETFQHNLLPNFVIKEGKSNDVSIINDNNVWRLGDKDFQYMQLITKSNREIKELYSSFDLAYGDVLITGLGFGILALWVANKPEVKSVTVIEYSQDVINLFLASNQLPDKVKIIVGDADNYVTDKHYNSLLLDHFKDSDPKAFTYERVRKVAKNIPHDLFWFWSIEQRYTVRICDVRLRDLFEFPIDLSDIDFGSKWQAWIDVLGIRTIPIIAPEKIREYVEYYTNRR